jgi:hypothetical protein
MATNDDREVDSQYVGELNFLERYGVEFLRHKCAREQTDVRVWQEGEVEEIRRQERRTFWFAAISGAVSGTLIAAIELWLRSWLVDDMDSADWDEMIVYWGAFMALAGAITVIEIGYLYWLVLSSIARMVNTVGIGVTHRPNDVIAVGISRAGLDMPNPRTSFHGVDPYARIHGLKLLLYTLAYRAKVGVSSIIMRILLRRILGRAALRAVVPFVAIPLYAVWNVLILRWIMREARARAAGPIAIDQLAARIDSERESVGDEEQELLLALVAEAMMCTRDAHPNFLLLLDRLIEQFGLDPDKRDVAKDWQWCRERLAALDSRMQELALQVLCMAIVLGGRPRRRHRRLAEDAFRACGLEFEGDKLKEAYDAFVWGQGAVAGPVENSRQSSAAG